MLPTTTLGRTGLQVTRLGLGTMPFSAAHHAVGWDPYSPEGRALCVRTVQTAVDLGINYIDTAHGYGSGHSESIIGEAIAGRRGRVVLATKFGQPKTPEQIVASVEGSAQRLGTDCIDLIQFHGGEYSHERSRQIVEDGELEAVEGLRERGLVRFVGFTTEEPYSGLELMATGRFDVVHLKYNLCYQSGAHHALDLARELNLGVAVMRPMTSDVFKRVCELFAPGWLETHNIYEVALKFVLSDSRVHVANVGMRWPHEVEQNVALVEAFEPPFDLAEAPRGMKVNYEFEDARLGATAKA